MRVSGIKSTLQKRLKDGPVSSDREAMSAGAAASSETEDVAVPPETLAEMYPDFHEYLSD